MTPEEKKAQREAKAEFAKFKQLGPGPINRLRRKYRAMKEQWRVADHQGRRKLAKHWAVCFGVVFWSFATIIVGVIGRQSPYQAGSFVNVWVERGFMVFVFWKSFMYHAADFYPQEAGKKPSDDLPGTELVWSIGGGAAVVALAISFILPGGLFLTSLSGLLDPWPHKEMRLRLHREFFIEEQVKSTLIKQYYFEVSREGSSLTWDIPYDDRKLPGAVPIAVQGGVYFASAEWHFGLFGLPWVRRKTVQPIFEHLIDASPVHLPGGSPRRKPGKDNRTIPISRLYDRPFLVMGSCASFRAPDYREEAVFDFLDSIKTAVSFVFRHSENKKINALPHYEPGPDYYFDELIGIEATRTYCRGTLFCAKRDLGPTYELRNVHDRAHLVKHLKERCGVAIEGVRSAEPARDLMNH
ncbi:MAG: hypothetical protein SF187_23470 [Deltaproteobacteria bacterium]|nr:hypothetical protein [Deltaproteobacteria bacterium]